MFSIFFYWCIQLESISNLLIQKAFSERGLSVYDDFSHLLNFKIGISFKKWWPDYKSRKLYSVVYVSENVMLQ